MAKTNQEEVRRRTNNLSFVQHLFTRYQQSYDFILLFGKELKKAFHHAKERSQPWIDKIKNAISGIFSFAQMLKTSIQITPIILSTLTILSAAPLIHYTLPSFLFEPLVIVPILLVISLYAGYSTYKDLVSRNKLDKQIEKNKRVNKSLKKKIEALENKLKEISPLKAHDESISSTNNSRYLVRRKNKIKTLSPTKNPSLQEGAPKARKKSSR